LRHILPLLDAESDGRDGALVLELNDGSVGFVYGGSVNARVFGAVSDGTEAVDQQHIISTRFALGRCGLPLKERMTASWE
jgi:hypothetical protein